MPAQPTSPAREAIRGTVPRLAEISDTLIYGEVWERPGLSRRDRSLITVAALLAMGRDQQLEGHLGRALANGVSRNEISELITHLAFYAGWPAAMTAALVAKEVFEKG
jgi:4-carboxymuconolactone decarboxylase